MTLPAFTAVLCSLCTLLLLGCLSPQAAESLPIRTLAKGAFSGIQEPGQQVIKDRLSWQKVWTDHLTSGKDVETLPTVDFSKEMVIVATMGRQRSGGYSIEITQVQPADTKLRITVSRKTPPPGSMTIQALTAPFHMVAVGRSDLEPEFVDARR